VNPPIDSSDRIPAMQTLRLRTATLDDMALIADMHARSRSSAYRGQLPDDYLDRAMPVEAVAHWQSQLPRLLDGAGQVLIAEAGGRPVGFACMIRPDADDSVLIDNLHALPQHKGGGVGTTLLDAAACWARELGARRMHLLVLETNVAAIGFYESRGWRLVGRKADTMGDTPFIASIYALALDAGQRIT
jgi:GNAT superfamily N-acetyltransferase